MFMVSYSITSAQTDSIIVAMMDGTNRGYQISLINQIYFSGESKNVREQELVQKVLSSFVLYQNYPNPFNPNTTIKYSLPKSGDVEARIFDIQGRIVRSISMGDQQSGLHSLVWDSRSNAGTIAASGTYFCQVIFNGNALIKKLILIK